LSFGKARDVAGHWLLVCLHLHVFYSGGFLHQSEWLPGYLIKERGYTVIKSGLYLAYPMLPPSVER